MGLMRKARCPKRKAQHQKRGVGGENSEKEETFEDNPKKEGTPEGNLEEE